MKASTQNDNIGHTIIRVYLLFCTGIFQLYLMSVTLGDLPVRLLLFCIFTAVTAIVYIIQMLRGYAFFRKKLYKIDFYMAAILLLSLGNIFIRIFQDNRDYTFGLLVSISVLSFFTISAQEEYLNEFTVFECLDLLLIVCAVIYVELIFHLTVFPQFFGMIDFLLQDKTIMRSFLVLSVSINILQFCCNKKKSKDSIYLILGSIGYFLLFLQQDILSILLISVLFLIIPLLFVPTAWLIKKSLILAFLFFFILGNMPLIINYTEILELDLQFDVMICIYADLLITIAGMVILLYWERIPKGFSIDVVVMKKMQKMYMYILELCGILLVAFLFLGPLEGFDEQAGLEILNQFIVYLTEAIKETEGTFRQVFKEYGILGILLLAMLFREIIVVIKKRFDHSMQSTVLTIITVVFIIQSFFYEQQVVTTPLYTFLITIALFQMKNEEEHFERL